MVALFFLGLLCSLGLSSLLVAAQQAAAVAYTPKLSRCPSGVSLVRKTGTTKQSLGCSESKYIHTRKSKVLPSAWSSYLQNVEKSAQSNDIPLPSYVSKLLSHKNSHPTLGIATSGGGYRAAMFDAAVLNVLDGRNKTSTQLGTGGLLQAASYITGLSGSGWLVGSLAQNNFPTLLDLIFGSTSGSGGWITQLDLLQPSTDPNVVVAFIGEMLQEIAGKYAAGFPVTSSDVVARSLSRHFVTGTTVANFFNTTLAHGSGVTFSSVSQLYVHRTFSQYIVEMVC